MSPFDPPETTDTRELSEQRFRAIIQHSRDLIIVCSRDGRIQFASAALETVSAALARATHYEPALNAELLLLAGDVHAALGESAESLASYEAAALVLADCVPRRSTARVWRDVADRLCARGETERGIAAYRKALSVLGVHDRSAAVHAAIQSQAVHHVRI